jgi:hypothetical protein
MLNYVVSFITNLIIAMNSKFEHRHYIEYPSYFSLTNFMETAHKMKWTGPALIQWESVELDAFFSIADREKLLEGRAYIYLCEGNIRNISFSLKPSIDMLNRDLALNNLLLLIRATEGMIDMPKLKATAIYIHDDGFSQMPDILQLPANLVTVYSLLANEQALKDQSAFRDWPALLE